MLPHSDLLDPIHHSPLRAIITLLPLHLHRAGAVTVEEACFGVDIDHPHHAILINNLTAVPSHPPLLPSHANHHRRYTTTVTIQSAVMDAFGLVGPERGCLFMGLNSQGCLFGVVRVC
nr:hypothetical protein [Tanacetum cinerariifolium]